MNFRHAIYFSGMISAHSQHLIEANVPLSDTALGHYWKSMRSWALDTQRRWQGQMNQFASIPHGLKERRQALLQEMLITAEEICHGEMMHRVWATVLSIREERAVSQTRRESLKGRGEAMPLVRSLHVAVLELRRSLLSFLLSGPDVPTSFLEQADRHRRRSENWTNFICGHLVIDFGHDEFVHNASDARHYDLEHLYYLLSCEIPRHEQPVHLTCLSLDYLLAMDAGTGATTARLPEDSCSLESVAGAMLNCFPFEAFNDQGRLRPIRAPRDQHEKILAIASKH